MVRFGDHVRDLQHLRAHRLPVDDDHADVGQCVTDRLFDPRHRFGRLPVDFQMDQRFRFAFADAIEVAGLVALEPHDRMTGTCTPMPSSESAIVHRIDEEGHVVIDDLQHGVRRLEAVLLQAGVEHANLRFTGLARAREIQEIRCKHRPCVRLGAVGKDGRLQNSELLTDMMVECAASAAATSTIAST